MPYSCRKCLCGSFAIPQRLVVCFMGFLTIVVVYTARGCLNLLIIDMVVQQHNTAEVKSECNVTSKPIEIKAGTIEWAPAEQATILASFFYGYILTHVPGGYLSDMYGAKYVLGASVLISGIMTVFTPLAVDNANYKLICIMRFIIGLAQGPIFPAVSTLMARWIPKSERGRVCAFVYSGTLVGNVVCYLATSLLTAYSRDWRPAFYFWAIVCFTYLCVHILYCFSLPETHPYLSDQEREMLKKEIGPKQSRKVPWCKILSDPACISIMLAWTGHAVTFFFISVNFPQYLRTVLNYNIVETGIYSSTPHVIIFISATIIGSLADCLVNKEYMTTLHCRKLFGFLGVFGPSAICQAAAYFRCKRTAAMITFHVAMLVSGFCYASVRVNSLDLTTNFAGVLSALINGAGALGFWPIPHLIAVMTTDNTTDQWINFYWVMTILATVTSILYVIGTKAETAEWDETEETT